MRAQEEAAEINWCDEASAPANEHPRLDYASKGQPATMLVPDRHIRVNLISAISHVGTARFMTYQASMETAQFLVFLGRLLRAARRNRLLVVDRLSAHATT